MVEVRSFDLSHEISFPSTYKASFRIEVPVWCNVETAKVPDSHNGHSSHDAGSNGDTEVDPVQTLTEPVLPVTNIATPPSPADVTDEAEQADETYLVPEGNGRFLFRRGLLKGAARTFEVRSAGNKYEVIAAWLASIVHIARWVVDTCCNIA